MNPTRNGKIARLPRTLREELNRRLADGEVGRRLVEWLNALPEVRPILAADFGGRPINEQNLSEWKQGGFAEWQRHQEAREWARTLAEQAEELDGDAGNVSLADRLAAPMAIALGHLLRESVGLEGTARQDAVLRVGQQLAQLRRGNHHAERVRLETERWEEHQEEVREKERKQAKWKEWWARTHFSLFPELDEEGMPRSPGVPAELQACLDASRRLKAAQTAALSQGESK